MYAKISFVMTKNNKISEDENLKKSISKGGREYKKNMYENEKGLSKETKHGVLAVVMFALTLFSGLSAFSWAGPAGQVFYKSFSYLFGVGYFLLPILFIMLGISFAKSSRPDIAVSRMVGSALFIISSLGIIQTLIGKGGKLGEISALPFVKLFDIYVGTIFLLAIFIISLIVIFDARPKIIPLFNTCYVQLKNKLFAKKEKLDDYEEIGEGAMIIAPTQNEEEIADLNPTSPQPSPYKVEGDTTDEEEFIPKPKKSKLSGYIPPPLDLLEKDRGKPGVGDIKANANIIKRTLQNFGIDVEMDEITIGPTVTRYALKPAEGVRLSKISSLQDNLALALAAKTIRVEAPIPGKSLVGIEVPNSTKTTVGLGSMLGSKEFAGSQKPLLVSIGKNVGGNPIFYDLAKMPHLLIAGTTGSGKSVTVHAILNSLLYRNSPDALKFIMVDAKRVELTLYNKIPHLLTPVITEAKKTILALKWAAKEMDRRYDILEGRAVRDISSYHKNILETAIQKNPNADDLPETMPYIVIVIDELADLMQAYPRELESAIVRLAQMSRAVGIHLVLSTQRPSVNVITGLIKANIPTRIALKVGSQIDSRTIIDKAGAEKLVGQGDMLFISQDAPEPVRIQSPFISEEEVKKVVKFLINNAKDDLPNDISITEGTITSGPTIFSSDITNDNGEEEDEMYEEARLIVTQAGKASTSYLQRRLKLGYARAARLMDMLEERGIIGPGDGAKPREIMEKPTDNSPDSNSKNIV